LLAAEPLSAIQDHATRLALYRTAVPTSLDSTGAAAALFDSLILVRLGEAGYSIVTPDSTQPVWEQVRDSVGGLYDPVTGKRDDERLKVIRHRTKETLKLRFGADYFVSGFVTAVAVAFNGGKAKWAGIEEKTGAPGGLGGALFGSYAGRIRGLSLVILISRLDDSLAYQGSGGLQLLDKVSGGELTRVPQDSLFADRPRMLQGLRLALDSLTRKIPATSAP
jgi:hypothetical protein